MDSRAKADAGAQPLASPAVSSCSTCVPLEREAMIDGWFDEVIEASFDDPHAVDQDVVFADAVEAPQAEPAAPRKDDLGPLSLAMALLWCVLTLMWSGVVLSVVAVVAFLA